MRRLVRLVVLLLVGLPLSAAAADLSADTRAAIDRLVTDAMARQDIPGLALAIVSDQRVYLRGYGFAHPKRPAAPDTVFRLASVSKTFTAVAAMQLAEGGKLDLDAPVQRYVPSFPEKPWPVTTRQLLAHLGGIRHYKGQEIYSTTAYTDSITPLRIFQADRLEHEPGTRYLYSTYGYNLAGAVVERVAGERFAEYVRRHVLVPAGMTRAQVDDPAAPIANLATGYDVAPRAGGLREAPAFNATNKIPGGGFVATADDMARFAIAMFGDALLRPETKAAMWTRQTTRDGTPIVYGLGWVVGEWRGNPTVSHGGAQPGVSTVLFLVPSRRCGVVVLTNRGGLKGMTTFARGLADVGCS